MTPIRTGRLLLRNWEERDRDLFHRINSDERVMEFFPFRRDRTQADAFMDRARAAVAGRGYGFSAAEVVETGECIGFVGLLLDDIGAMFPPGTVEIGWRLAPEFWGKGYACEGARAWLEFGFETLGLTEIISIAVWNNRRSTAVMERIGMQRDPARDFEHPAVPDTHPWLKPHVTYRLSRTDWLANAEVAGNQP